MLYGGFWCFRDPIAAVPVPHAQELHVRPKLKLSVLVILVSSVANEARVCTSLSLAHPERSSLKETDRMLWSCEKSFFAWTQFRLNPLRSSGIGQDGGERRSAEPKACHHRRAPQVGLEAPSKLGPGGVRWGRGGHAPLPPGAILGAAGGGKGDGEGEGEEAAGG